MTTPPTQPATRDLADVVNALAIVEDELRFQVQRLANEEDEFLVRLREQYDRSIGAVVTLKRYQEGRLRRQRRPDTLPGQGEFAAHVDEAGVPLPHTTDDADTHG